MSPAPGDTRKFSSTEISFAAEVMASSQEPAPWSRLLWPQLLLEGLRESVDTTWTPRDVCDHLGTEAHVTDLEQANGVWETQLTFIFILFTQHQRNLASQWVEGGRDFQMHSKKF